MCCILQLYNYKVESILLIAGRSLFRHVTLIIFPFPFLSVQFTSRANQSSRVKSLNDQLMMKPQLIRKRAELCCNKNLPWVNFTNLFGHSASTPVVIVFTNSDYFAPFSFTNKTMANFTSKHN
jgi:hypothetical protein